MQFAILILGMKGALALIRCGFKGCFGGIFEFEFGFSLIEGLKA
jgi:hypothetical protein